MSKLYLRNSDRYSEEHVLVAEMAADGSRVRASFAVPAGRPPDAVRFDPSSEAGIYRIHAVRWCEPGSRTELIRFDGGQLRATVVGVGGVMLPMADPTALEFWAYDQDPQVEMRWPQVLQTRSKPTTLEIEWAHDKMSTDDAAEIALRLLGVDADALIAEVTPAPVVLSPHEAAIAAAAATVENAVSGLQEQMQAIERRLAAAERIRASQEASAKEQQDRHREWQDHLLAELTDRIRSGQVLAAELLARQAAVNDSLAQQRAQLQRIDDQLVSITMPLPQRFRAWMDRVAAHWVAFRRTAQRNFSAWLDLARVRRYSLVPLGDIDADGEDAGTPCWKATSSDPRFLLQPHQEGRCSSGWYLMRCRLRTRDGLPLVDPVLYADYGAGMSEATAIALRLHPDRLDQRVLVKLAGDAIALRLDPSTQSCDFIAGPTSLRKLSRTEAALRLAAPVLRELLRSPRMLPIAVRDAFRALREGGAAEVEKRLRGLHDARSRDAGYASWTARFDTLDSGDLVQLRIAVERLPRRPLISLVVPVYNTPENLLRRCLDSVLDQAYPDWELCIADDASTAAHVRQVLDEYVKRDARVRVVHRETNGHISAASNSALDIATGEYVALLDHDDELPAHALFMVAERLGRDEGLKLVYSDEDKIDESGRRYDPYFKPDWNPDLFHGQNYVCHLGVYDTALVRAVGGFREGYEGSQDFDLALRCIERLSPAQIGHIPHVLYHWRAVAGSTARASTEKSYTDDASQRALRDHFARTGADVAVETTPQGYFRCRYPLPSPLPKVSLIVPTRDRVQLLRMCVMSLLERTDYPELEILIVDNQSSEAKTLEYFETLRDEPRVRILRYDAPFNFSALNNFAAAHATGELVGLVNNDIEVIDAGWLREMVSHAVRPDVGGVGCKLYYPDGRIQHAGVVVGFGGVAGHSYQRMPGDTPGQMNRARLVQDVSSVTAACMLLRRDVFEAVGGLDEGLTVAFNDIDFCLRILQRGYRIVWTPFAELYHHESASRGYEDSPEKLARFHREIRFMQDRWGDGLRTDPAYNPNLAYEGEPFELAWPPRVTYPFRAEA